MIFMDRKRNFSVGEEIEAIDQIENKALKGELGNGNLVR